MPGEKFEVSNIPDKKEDVRYAMHFVGVDAKPTGRMRVILETSRIELEWRGSLGVIWLPIPGVSKKDASMAGPHDLEGPLKFNGG